MASARRWRGSEPPWPQAVVQPPAWPPQVQLRRRPLVALWRPRARTWSPPWFQAAANTNQPVFVVPTPRRRPLATTRRTRTLPVTADVAMLPSRRSRGTPPPQRRPRSANPPWTQAAAPVNPTFVDWTRRRVLQLFRACPPRGRRVEPPWGQSAAAPNPTFVELFRRRTLQRSWPRPVRARRSEPPWGQAPPNSNQPLFVLWATRRNRPWSWTRRRSPVAPIAEYAAPLSPAARRRISGAPRRPRVAVPPLAQADGQPRPVRIRSAWTARRPRRTAQLVLAAPAIAPPWLPTVVRKILGRWWPWRRRSRSVVVLPLTVAPVTTAPGTVLALDRPASTVATYDQAGRTVAAVSRTAASVGAFDAEA